MVRQEILDWESEVSSRPCYQIPVGPWVSCSGPPFPHSYVKHTGPHIIQALRGSDSRLGPGQGRSRVAWLWGYASLSIPASSPVPPTRLEMLSKLCGLVTSKQRSRTLASG